MRSPVRLVAVIIFAVFSFIGAAHAQNSVFYLPQVANGTFGGGSFRTTFIAFNPNSVAVSIEIELSNDDGGPLVVTIPGLGTGSEFNVVLQPGGGRILQTNGAGNLATGAATVTANTNSPLGVSAVFTLFDGTGKFVTEAGVGSSTPLTQFVLPVDTTGNFNTGLALFNFNATNANLTLVLLNENGTEVARTDIVLAAGRHRASFIAGEFFAGVSNVKGTLRITSSVAIAALTLRQNGAPLSFTTLPVVSLASTQTYFLLPQVANGTFAGGKFQTTFIIFNLSQEKADVTLRLTKDDGSPLPVNLGNLGTNSVFNIELEPNRAFFGRTDGTGALSAGAARVSSNKAIGVSSIFTVLDAADGFITEAGVGDSPALTSFSIPVDVTGNFNTGVAFFNNPPAPGPVGPFPAATGPVTLTLQLLNEQGAAVGQPVQLELGPTEHTARFVPELVQGTSNFRGTLAVKSTGEVSAVTLRQNGSPLVFTTLPVAAGAFDPTQPAATALLQLNIDNVDGTADRVVNAQLPGGFRLSGSAGRAPAPVGGSQPAAEGLQASTLRMIGMHAVSNTGRRFTGRVNDAGDKYLVVVPAGVYRLIFCYQLNGGVINPLAPVLTYELPGTVQVQADTTRNVLIPALNFFNVSGTVSGLAKLPSPIGANLVFTSTNSHTQATFIVGQDGSYTGSLPNGTYRAGLTQPVLQNNQFTQLLTIFELGTTTISSGSQTANFQVPDLSTLTGKVTSANVPIVQGTNVIGSDRRAPAFEADDCVTPPAFNTSVVNQSNGDYRMALQKNIAFDLNVNLPVQRGNVQVGIFNFPAPFLQLTMDADKSQSFNLGTAPVERKITGKVTGPDGKAVANVAVSAIENTLTGLPNVSYFGFTSTDQNGNYEIIIRNSNDVDLIFFPLLPEP